MGQLQAELIKTLEAVGVALINLGAAYLIYYINKTTEKAKVETKKLQDEQKIQLVNNAIDRVEKLAIDSVKSTESAIAKELRQAVIDGKVDREELCKLGSQVANDVYCQLSTEVKDVLSSEITDVQQYIQTVVEKSLFDIKNK